LVTYQKKDIRRFLLKGALKEQHHPKSQQCLPKFSLQHVCSMQYLGLFLWRDRGKMFELFFLSCLDFLCTWHHIRL